MYWYRGIRCKSCKKSIALKSLAHKDEEPPGDMSRLISFGVDCPHCLKEFFYEPKDLIVFGTLDPVRPAWKM